MPTASRPLAALRAPVPDLPGRLAAALDALEVGPGPLLVACSGGLDSTVLLAGLHRLSPQRGLHLAVAHVHHGLRGPEADGDARHAAALAAERGLPFFLDRVDPEGRRRGGPSRSRPSLEEAARTLRYQALERRAESWARGRGAARAPVATGHHLDDQAETLLLRLLRGSGPDGLAGIPARSPDGRRLRPLLGFERAELRAWAESQGLVWREDASNRDPRHARSRLRTRWLPGLGADFNPRLLRSLARLAEAQRKDSEWLAELVEAEAQSRLQRVPGGAGLRIARAGWSALPEALALRLLRRAWIDLGGGRDLSARHLERARAFVAEGRPGAVLEWPGGLRLRAGREEVRVGPAPDRAVE